MCVCILEAEHAQTASRAVAVDQVGYLTVAPKYVFSTHQADSFFVVNRGSVVFRGALTLWKSPDPATNLTVYKGDFSLCTLPGMCRVVTSVGDTSATFSISDSAYNQAFRMTLKGFYFQRCGMPLLPAFAGPWQRNTCHAADAIFHSTADSAGSLHDAIGGWHDAGDYGKYVVNAGISVGTLLLAYEMFPARFNDDDIGIPESGNGIPDILDEARYELEWILKMQRADGAFWFKVTPKQFEGFVMPSADASTRYIYQVSSTATGDAAAVLAKAARLYKPFDSTFARKCLAAARLAWQFLTSNSTIVPPGGFTNPSDTFTGQYGDANDADERMWAASELFETTGDSICNAYVLSHYQSVSAFGSAMAWPDVGPLGLLSYLRSGQPSANQAVQSLLRSALLTYCDAQVAQRNSSGYHMLLSPGSFYWGSNSSDLNAAILLLAGSVASGNALYADAAADQLHYVLGTNGFARSYVTGLGENPPMQPHHRPSASDGILLPVPGLIVGGPNQYGGDPVLQALVNLGTPPALCYIDTVASYASNEIAINWNAPLVFIAGYFHGRSGGSGVGEERDVRPERYLHEQSYPNPFNPVPPLSSED